MVRASKVFSAKSIFHQFVKISLMKDSRYIYGAVHELGYGVYTTIYGLSCIPEALCKKPCTQAFPDLYILQGYHKYYYYYTLKNVGNKALVRCHDQLHGSIIIREIIDTKIILTTVYI